jgi:alanyl-tRNA synthetase
MTKQLYFENTYLFECMSNVSKRGKDERGIYICLDQTIFHPQGGGQPFDQGMIGQSRCVDVRRVEGEIRHYLDSEEHQERVVLCVIDEQRRLLCAKYHTGAHFISHIIEEMHPLLKAVKGHAFPHEAYVEFQGTMNIDQARFQEKLAQNLPVLTLNHALRGIQIGNYPAMPCGGTHLANTGEIGYIKIVKTKAKNETVRISYEVK